MCGKGCCRATGPGAVSRYAIARAGGPGAADSLGSPRRTQACSFPPKKYGMAFQLWFRGFYVFNFRSFIPVVGEQFLGLASILPLSEPGQHAANEFAKLETPHFTHFFSRWPRLWLC